MLKKSRIKKNITKTKNLWTPLSDDQQELVKGGESIENIIEQITEGWPFPGGGNWPPGNGN